MALLDEDIEYDDTLWKQLLAKVHNLDQMHVRVGVLEGKGGEEMTEHGFTLIELAAAHEFGTFDIPERSFLRRTFVEKETEMVTITTKLARMVVTDRIDPKKALAVLGSWGATEVKNTVTKGPHIPPPLKPATIARKGSDRPLVDTGRLVGAVTYEVVEGDDDE